MTLKLSGYKVSWNQADWGDGCVGGGVIWLCDVREIELRAEEHGGAGRMAAMDVEGAVAHNGITPYFSHKIEELRIVIRHQEENIQRE